MLERKHILFLFHLLEPWGQNVWFHVCIIPDFRFIKMKSNHAPFEFCPVIWLSAERLWKIFPILLQVFFQFQPIHLVLRDVSDLPFMKKTASTECRTNWNVSTEHLRNELKVTWALPLNVLPMCCLVYYISHRLQNTSYWTCTEEHMTCYLNWTKFGCSSLLGSNSLEHQCNILIRHHFPEHIRGVHKWNTHLYTPLGCTQYII